ncbi:probable glucosamine 6-phosphate N-acetyltransferase [Phymastichus coffea]|uniref:probable glucosamine 6-phosphate N-acetyltransferase n=1 Tax=Phymastichus coffea TaxID=108790 RepID=UPI00273BEF01|nr:probable glucosamine 6-phosphate N-acetyltransferase [Phymastichus coffea]
MASSRTHRNALSEVDGIALFNPNLLERVANQLRSDGLIFRPLNSKDYEKGFLQLLSQLTEVGNITKDQFLNRFHNMKSSGGYYVIVVEDFNCDKVIGSATLVVEQKFIHSCGLRGHLEDVVVNSEYRGKQLGKLVVMAVKHLARTLQCYKLTLECKDRLIPFYESLDFKKEPGNSNSMNIRFSYDNPAEQSRL